MKQVLTYVIMIVTLVSCADMEGGRKRSEGPFALHLTIVSDALTKSAPVDDGSFSEACVCLWDKSGRYLLRRDMGAGRSTVIDSLIPGTYTVSVLAGGLRSCDVQSYSGYQALSLGAEEAASDKGLLMSGAVEVMLDDEDATVSVNTERYLSRLRLAEVVNSVGEDVLLKGAMLINVPAEWTVGAQDEPAGWLNLAGRVDGEVVTAFSAEAADLTYRDLGSALLSAGESCRPDCLLYCFPNNVDGDAFGPQASFGKTRLVVVAQVGDDLMYYPVTVAPAGGMARNTSYDVSLTMLSYGSSDPNLLVPSGMLSFIISQSDYDNVNYDEKL